MKKFIGLWFWGILLFAISSCSEDEEPAFVPEGEEEILITGESGATVVNTKDIVLGGERGRCGIRNDFHYSDDKWPCDGDNA